MQPLSVRLPAAQRIWLDQQAARIDGLNRADLIRLCIAAAMDSRVELPQLLNQTTTTTTTDA